MTIAAIAVLVIYFLAIVEVAQESDESFWDRITREAKRRAKELL